MSAHLVHGYIARMMAAVEPMAARVQVVLNTAADAMPEPPPHVLVAPGSRCSISCHAWTR